MVAVACSARPAVVACVVQAGTPDAAPVTELARVTRPLRLIPAKVERKGDGRRSTAVTTSLPRFRKELLVVWPSSFPAAVYPL